MSTTESKPSINAKITKLNQDIEWFYSDDFALDQASEKYKQAASLAKEIEGDLDGLKNEIEIISKDFSAS